MARGAMPIKGLLFDKDGTLFDFRRTWGGWAKSFLHEIAGFDETRATMLGARVGFNFGQAEFAPDSIIISAAPDEIAAELVDAFPNWTVSALTERIVESATRAPAHPVTPLRPLLSGWQRDGLKLGLATNDGEAVAHAHLTNAGVRDLFDFIAGFDSGYGAKPAPGMQRAFCKAMDLDAAQVAMVGDSAHDLLAGRAAGMRTIAVLTGIATEAELAPLADVVLPHIGHIVNWLGEHGD